MGAQPRCGKCMSDTIVPERRIHTANGLVQRNRCGFEVAHGERFDTSHILLQKRYQY